MLSCFGRVRFFLTPCTAVRQPPLSLRILQARILEWVAISSSRASSRPKDRTQVSCIGRRVLDCLSRQGRPGLSDRLESCGLSAEVFRQLFMELGRNSSLRFLSLADNDLSHAELERLREPPGTAASALKELS